MSEDFIGRVGVGTLPYEDTYKITTANWSKVFIIKPQKTYYLLWGFETNRNTFEDIDMEILQSIVPKTKEIISLPEIGTGEEVIIRDKNHGNRNRKESLRYTVTSLGDNEYRINFIQEVHGYDNDEGGTFFVAVKRVFMVVDPLV